MCRGGGGAAERLHASCRHRVAEAEVEGRERRQAAQSSHPHVGHLVAAAEVERLERMEAAHGSYSLYPLVRHPLAPPGPSTSTCLRGRSSFPATPPPGTAAPACPRPRRWSLVSAPAASPAHRARPSTHAHQPHRGGGLREPKASLLLPSRLQQLQHRRHQLIWQIRPPALGHRLPPPLRSNLTGMERQRHRPPMLVKVPALHVVLDVWWVCLAAACGRADTA
jgi:hypothetical protein